MTTAIHNTYILEPTWVPTTEGQTKELWFIDTMGSLSAVKKCKVCPQEGNVCYRDHHIK